MAINVEAFYDMINGIAGKRIEATPMDLTIDAEISKPVNVDTGEYKVQYQGNIFSAFTVDPTVTYNGGERVYVLVPQGDFSTKKIILGRSAYNNTLSNAQRQDLTNFYIEHGPNWVSGEEGTYKMDHTPLEICAVPFESKQHLDSQQGDKARYEDQGFRRWSPEDEKEPRDPQTRYPVNYMSDEEIDKVDTLFQNFAKSYEYIKVAANFSTKFLSTHAQGKYSLRVTFISQNPKWVPEDDPLYEIRKDEPRWLLNNYDLGFPQFSGSPYQFTVATPQKAYFAVNIGQLRGLYKVSLMQDGAFVADIRPSYDAEGNLQYRLDDDSILDENNIICDNIDIRFCEKINMLDTLYYAWIETPQGDSVYDRIAGDENGRGSVDLIPRMIYNGGQSVAEVTADCRIEWFREDLSVFKGTPEEETRDEWGKVWTDYTGPGWRPISYFIEKQDQDYQVAADGTLTVKKSAVAWQWKYKVVLIYNGEVFGTATQIIKNKNSKYDLFLERFHTDDSNIDQLRINDKNALVGFHTVPGSEPPRKYPEWFGTWYVMLSDESYQLAFDDAWYFRGPIDITNWLIYDSVTFRVACYDPFQVVPPDGLGDIASGYQVQEIGYLDLTIVNANDLSLLIDWIGRKQFNYTALGTAYPSISKQEHTLQVKLNYSNKEEIQDGSAFEVTILAPDGAKIGSRTYYNGENVEVTGNGHQPPGSMMYDMWVDQANTVHFKVRQELEPTATKNTLIARVHSIKDDKFYEEPCVVEFTQDGQRGTQGTEWTCPIDLTNSKAHQVQRFNGETQTYYTQAALPFSMRLGVPTLPLVVDRTIGADGKIKYVDSHENRVFLRPFPTKNGKDLMSNIENEGKRYKIVTYWNVAYPKNHFFAPLRGASFLRMKRTEPGMAGVYLTPTNYPGTNGEKCFYQPDTVNPKNAPGMYGMTVWDGAVDADQNINSVFGAIEVEFHDAGQDGIFEFGQTEDPLAAGLYNFVVKAQIDIYANESTSWDYVWGTHKEEEVKNDIPELKPSDGKYHRVKSFVTYMPVDVFIRDQGSKGIKFDCNKCSLNWPIDIQFDARGYNPVIWEDYLEFYYGYYPDTQTRSNGVFMEPRSETPLVQKVTNDSRDEYFDSKDFSGDTHLLASEEKPREYRYRLRPSSHMNWQEGTVGTLSAIFKADAEKQIPGGIFYRNQVYVCNNYGNVDINSWDGQGIDINEDEGTIFAPTIGAGFKAPLTNAFSGVLMGVNKGFPRKMPDGSIDQFLQAGATVKEELDYPYMTGIFGYQGGYSSFGLLENGTAFFGRADRGGRIIIDGYNATIYGGANGVLSSPRIGDKMWNNMRLTFVDLSHATSDLEDYTQDADERGNEDNPTGMVYDDDHYVNGRDPDYQQQDLNMESVRPEETGKDGREYPVTTAVQGITQGFSGRYFGDGVEERDPYGVSAQLPWWYAQTWYGAYLKPKGRTPWFLDKNYIDEGMRDIEYTEDPNMVVSGHHLYKLTALARLEDYNIEDVSEYDSDDWDNNASTAEEGRKYGYAVNYWNPDIQQIRAYMKKGIDDTGEDEAINLSGFGPSRASTTPAIEIGQHPPGLMPGPIPWQVPIEDIFEDIWIPGDRNFMVTYDGTMWAMNGVFLGNVIGSNIIGGRLRGVEIGVGDSFDNEQDKPEYLRVPVPNEDWSQLLPTAFQDLGDAHPKYRGILQKFYVTHDGDVTCRNIAILGGCIHLGSFHIIGGDDAVHEKDGSFQHGDGHLIQTGDSDFIGVTHMYGGLGIGPNFGSEDDYPDSYGQGTGNFFQTQGLAAIGIIAPENDTQYHAMYTFDANDKYKGCNQLNTPLKYKAGDTPGGDPQIENPAGRSVEQTAMFSVDTRTAKKVSNSSGGGGQNPGGGGDGGMDQSTFIDKINEYQRVQQLFINYCWRTGEEALRLTDMYYDQLKPICAILDPIAGMSGLRAAPWSSDAAEYVAVLRSKIGEFKRKPSMAGNPANTSKEGAYMGHFWPMAFRYIKVESTADEDDPSLNAAHGYATTMDIFKSKPFKVSLGTSNPNGSPEPVDGGNYFRIGPWGQEGFRYYICQEWQKEDESEAPTVQRGQQTVRGVMGLVDRAGYGDNRTISRAIGMTSWGSAPIIMTSDENFAIRVKNGTFIESGNVDTQKNPIDLRNTNEHKNGYRSVIYLGGGTKEDSHISIQNVVQTNDGANSGYIAMEATKDNSATSWGLGLKHDKAIGGIIIDPEKYKSGALTQRKGVYVYGKDDTEVHIVAGDTTKHLDHTDTTADTDLGYAELWVQRTQLRGTADEAWSFCLGNNAHAAYYGSYRIGMDKTSTMYCHPKQLAIWGNSQPGQNFELGTSIGVIFTDQNAHFSDGPGYIRGQGGHIYFEGDWADENHQHNIYARFA